MIVLVCLTAILFSSCSGEYKIRIGDSKFDIKEHYTPCVSMNQLDVYKIDEAYLVTVLYGDVVCKIAEFSAQRKCLRTRKLNLITNEGAEHYLGMSFEALTGELGRPHFDEGSGFYIPSYITEDGYLICLYIDEDDCVYAVRKYDLFKGDMVELCNAE